MGVASIERGDRAHPPQGGVRIFNGAFTLRELYKSRATHVNCEHWQLQQFRHVDYTLQRTAAHRDT